MRSYDITFPRHPVDAVLARLKPAGMRCVRPLDPFGMGRPAPWSVGGGVRRPAPIPVLGTLLRQPTDLPRQLQHRFRRTSVSAVLQCPR